MAVRASDLLVASPPRVATPAHLRWWVIVFVSLFVVAGIGFIYLTQASSVSTLGYDISALQLETQRWQARTDQQRFLLAEKQSLASIEKAARSRLGMAPPTKVVQIKADKSLSIDSVSPSTANSLPRVLAQAPTANGELAASVSKLTPFSQGPSWR